MINKRVRVIVQPGDEIYVQRAERDCRSLLFEYTHARNLARRPSVRRCGVIATPFGPMASLRIGNVLFLPRACIWPPLPVSDSTSNFPRGFSFGFLSLRFRFCVLTIPITRDDSLDWWGGWSISVCSEWKSARERERERERVSRML